jgi:acyl dehydratase
MAQRKNTMTDCQEETVVYFEDLKIGMTVETAPAVIKKEKMMAFARDYDNIPLHTDEEYAKTTPFGGLIAPGVMTFMSVWVKYLEQDLLGPELLAGKSTKIEWIKPVYADDVLTGKVTVTNLVRRNARNGLVEFFVEGSTVVLTETSMIPSLAALFFSGITQFSIAGVKRNLPPLCVSKYVFKVFGPSPKNISDQ